MSRTSAYKGALPSIRALAGGCPRRIHDLRSGFDGAGQAAFHRLVQRAPGETVSGAQADLMKGTHQSVTPVGRGWYQRSEKERGLSGALGAGSGGRATATIWPAGRPGPVSGS